VQGPHVKRVVRGVMVGLRDGLVVRAHG